jgi:hypothetical protein
MPSCVRGFFDILEYCLRTDKIEDNRIHKTQTFEVSRCDMHENQSDFYRVYVELSIAERGPSLRSN